jgi:transcriptional regulator with XRE-family HTH domain
MSKGARPVNAGSSSARARGGPSGTGGPTYLRILEQVTASGITQQELGNAVGASVRSVQTWASGDAAPRGVRAERLLDVKFIVEELSSVYSEEGVEIWLRTRNRNLHGQRPIDLLTDGQIEQVVEEAQRLSGAM